MSVVTKAPEICAAKKKREKSRVWKQDFSRVQEFILWAIILNLIIWNTHRPVNTEGDEIKILLS